MSDMCSRQAAAQISDKEVAEHLNGQLDRTPLVRDFRTGVIGQSEVLKAIEEAGPNITQTLDNFYTLLHPFSVLGDYDIVKKLWDLGVRPTSGENTCTLLHCAVRTHPSFGSRDEDRARMLRLFLSAKETHGEHLYIDKKSECGMTAIRIATCLRLENCVEVLLEHGASANPPSGENYSLLHYAVGNSAIIKMLLNAYGGNIDWQDSEGRTALFLAIESGKVESALTLLEKGADPNIRNNEGIAPLFKAAKMGQMEVVRALVRCKSDINAPGGGQGITALHWAAFKEMEELVVFLIENGADVTIADTKGRTPLSMVSEKLQLKMKEVVSRCSPGVCPRTLAASPAMTAERKAMEACCHGNISALCNLIKSGVDVNFRCKQTESSLIHRAVYYGQISVVVFLSHHGANVKAVDKDKDTVLHFATMKEFPHGSHTETLSFLISLLAELLNTQNRLGDTPLMLATRNCLPRRVRVLLKSKADAGIANHRGETPLHVACQSIQSIEILFHIVECSKDLNKKDSSGLTPLMHAVKHGCVPAAKYLLLKGAQPDIRDPQGKTALYQATENLNYDMAEVLMMGGADPKIPSFEKNLTPAHIATQKRNKMMLKILLEFGADVYDADSDGNTVLDIIPSAHLREAIKVIVQARDEITSELRAPRDKNAPSPAMATPTSNAFNNCAVLSACNKFPCNETAATSNQESEDCTLGGISDSTEAGDGYCLSTSDFHWGRSLVNQSSLRPEGSVEEEGAAEREENEVEEEGTGGEMEGTNEEELSLERFKKLQSELSTLKKAYAETKDALRSATKHNDELDNQIASLGRNMELKRSQMASRHLHHAVTFSMHAICHNVLHNNQPEEECQNGQGDSTGMPLLDSQNAASSASMESGISSMTADDRDHPVCDNRAELSDGMDCIRSNEKRQEYQTQAEKRSDSLESSGSEVSEEESFKYIMAGVGLHSNPLFQPINHTKIQWWMVSKSDYELTDQSLNGSSEPTSRFFDVSRGTFRHIDVAVRTVRDVTSWNIENYLSFIKEVNFLSCLHCPWIVQFLCGCFDSANETCSIVNEYMSHGSLYSILHEKKVELDPATRIGIVRDISCGVLFLHSHKLLHRHLNPSNILIGEHFNAKLNDFGLHETKLKSGHYEHPNHTYQAYMAPEALGKEDFTMATDTYSFGIIMFECWTSKKAFANLLGNPMAMGVQLMMGTRPDFPTNVPSDYGTLASQCWHKDPESRPSFEVISSTLKGPILNSS